MFDIVDVLLFLLFLVTLGSVYWYWTIPKNLPPGPLGLPFIGSSIEFWDGSKQPKQLFENVKKYGPIFKMYIANKLVIVLGDYDTIHEALVNQGDVFAGRPHMNIFLPKKLVSLGVITSEGDLWKDHRRFALTTLRDFGAGRPILEPRLAEETEFLCERVGQYAKTGQPFDPQSLITCAVSNMITQLVFGHRFEYDDKEFVGIFSALTKRISANGVGFLSPFVMSPIGAAMTKWLPLSRKMSRETQEFVDYVERQMKETMATFDPDQEPTNFVHAYLQHAATNHGSQHHFDTMQLLATCHDLFFAGTETTSTTIRWAILHLAYHPEIQEKLYQEIKNEVGTNILPSYAERSKLHFAEAVVMESQRIADLAPLGVARRTLESTKLAGYDIPEDTIVVAFLNNVLQNGELYPDPLKFKPERFLDGDGKVIKDPKMIPFQIGKRICLGESMARMELFMFIIGLVSRFKFYFPKGKDHPSVDPMIGFASAPAAYEVCVEARDE